MQDTINKAFDLIDNRREEVLKVYEEFVNQKSYVKDVESVKEFSETVKGKLEELGFECNYIEVGEGSADTLVGVLGEDRNADPILFTGHLDTVLPNDAFEDNPFYIEDGKAYGPGVLDMKGGILIALNTIRTLNEIGYDERPIKVILSGNEETLHENSDGAKVFEEEAQGGYVAFNMETGLINNSVCVGRKGCLRYTITVEGVESHSGNDFWSGKSAIVEMAHKIIDFHNITDKESGKTVNIGTIEGGTVPNAIPKHCEVILDMRYNNVEQRDEILESVKEICAKTYIDGTTTTYSFLNGIDVFEQTEGGMKLFNYIKDISAEYELGEEMAPVTLGGGSDAAYTTAAGVPTICSVGTRGQWNHTTREYAVVESLFERSKLFTAAVLNLEKFEK